MWKKILPIVAVLTLGWIGINLFGGKEATTTIADATDTAVSDAAGAATDAAANATDAVTDAAADATDAVTDAAADATDAVTDAAADATDATTDAAADATDAATDATDAATDAAAAADATDAATDAAADATTEATESFSLAGFSRQIGGVFGTTTSVLSGVTDEDSAKAALPALEDASASLEAVASTFSAVPEAAQGPLKGIMEKGMGRIQPIADAALANEGVGSVLNPVVGPMMETLKGLIE